MSWLYYLLACAALTLAPGPDILFVIAKGLESGRRVALMTAWGMCSGCWVHTFAVAFGVAALCASHPNLFLWLSLFGAGYLFYLAYANWRAPAATLSSAAPVSAWAAFRRGVMMNLLNPKVLLFFLAFLPGFVNPESALSPRTQLIILGGLFFAQGVVLFSWVAYFAGAIGGYLRRSQRFATVMRYISTFVLATLGISILIPWLRMFA